jgi:hypothetical protein
MPKQKAKEKNKEFNFLSEEAKKLGGFREARIIGSNRVVVEINCRFSHPLRKVQYGSHLHPSYHGKTC